MQCRCLHSPDQWSHDKMAQAFPLLCLHSPGQWNHKQMAHSVLPRCPAFPLLMNSQDKDQISISAQCPESRMIWDFSGNHYMNPLSFPVPCGPHGGGVASESPEHLIVYRHTHLLPTWSVKLRPRQGTGWNSSAEPAELRDLKEWLKVPVKLFKLA